MDLEHHQQQAAADPSMAMNDGPGNAAYQQSRDLLRQVQEQEAGR